MSCKGKIIHIYRHLCKVVQVVSGRATKGRLCIPKSTELGQRLRSKHSEQFRLASFLWPTGTPVLNSWPPEDSTGSTWELFSVTVSGPGAFYANQCLGSAALDLAESTDVLKYRQTS